MIDGSLQRKAMLCKIFSLCFSDELPSFSRVKSSFLRAYFTVLFMLPLAVKNMEKEAEVRKTIWKKNKWQNGKKV